jgi:hypothetical protein
MVHGSCALLALFPRMEDSIDQIHVRGIGKMAFNEFPKLFIYGTFNPFTLARQFPAMACSILP